MPILHILILKLLLKQKVLVRKMNIRWSLDMK